MIAGTLHNESSYEILSSRCKKLVAIFTPGLLKNENAMSLLAIAQHMGLKNRKNTLIPVMYKR